MKINIFVDTSECKPDYTGVFGLLCQSNLVKEPLAKRFPRYARQKSSSTEALPFRGLYFNVTVQHYVERCECSCNYFWTYTNHSLCFDQIRGRKGRVRWPLHTTTTVA